MLQDDHLAIIMTEATESTADARTVRPDRYALTALISSFAFSVTCYIFCVHSLQSSLFCCPLVPENSHAA